MSDALDILLVEDDAVFAAVLQRSLQRRGHRVQWEQDVAAARAGLAAHAFSHAILDLKLANESSLPLIPVLLEANPAMQVLVLTGYASIQTAVQAVKLGAIVFHEKLGTVADKVERVATLARQLVEQGIVQGADPAEAELAARLAKADLVTEMEMIKHPFRSGVKAQLGIEF